MGTKGVDVSFLVSIPWQNILSSKDEIILTILLDWRSVISSIDSLVQAIYVFLWMLILYGFFYIQWLPMYKPVCKQSMWFISIYSFLLCVEPYNPYQITWICHECFLQYAFLLFTTSSSFWEWCFLSLICSCKPSIQNLLPIAFEILICSVSVI